MLQEKEESSLLHKRGKKKKFLYLDKFENYKLTNDEKIKIMEKAIKGVYIVLGVMFIFAISMTIYYLLK